MTDKEESEKLMNGILPLAERMLKEYGEFHPYGGYLRPNGELVHVGANDSETVYPKAKDLIYLLRSSFQEMARDGRCKAIAIVFDVKVKLPGSEDESDAVQISLDHAGGYSVDVFLPYQIVDREVIYGKTFAQRGKHEFFGGT
jgi:hypothetical protein